MAYATRKHGRHPEVIWSGVRRVGSIEEGTCELGGLVLIVQQNWVTTCEAAKTL